MSYLNDLETLKGMFISYIDIELVNTCYETSPIKVNAFYNNGKIELRFKDSEVIYDKRYNTPTVFKTFEDFVEYMSDTNSYLEFSEDYKTFKNQTEDIVFEKCLESNIYNPLYLVMGSKKAIEKKDLITFYRYEVKEDEEELFYFSALDQGDFLNGMEELKEFVYSEFSILRLATEEEIKIINTHS